jgi:gliding-associated putative ABC transporter substrate-binding component GldG
LKKTVLATSSERTKIVPVPSIVTLNIVKVQPNLEEFQHMYAPIAVLVEGEFTSAFKGLLPVGFDTIQEINYKEVSSETRQIFISDGDIIRNRFDSKSMQPYPTGFDLYTGKNYDNADFILNCVNYLSADDELLSIRAKSFKVGTLNPVAVKEKKKFYILLNTMGSLVLIGLMATVMLLIRKWRYKITVSGND